MSVALPHYVAKLFWEVDITTVDPEKHQDYVLERVMSRGGWEAMRWLMRTYSRNVLGAFLLRRGTRLAPRERAYWAVMTGIELPPATGGGRPGWAGT